MIRPAGLRVNVPSPRAVPFNLVQDASAQANSALSASLKPALSFVNGVSGATSSSDNSNSKNRLPRQQMTSGQVGTVAPAASARAMVGAVGAVGVAVGDVMGELLSLVPRSAYQLGNLMTGAILGQGAFGQVYLAEDKVSGDQVVVKKIPTGSVETLKAVRREAEILKHLKPACEPYLLCYEGLIEEKGYAYLVTKLEPDMITLDDALYRTPGWIQNELQIGEVVANLLAGVKIMHAKGVAHRDIKPANILVSRSGDSKVKFIDFGLSCLFRGCLTDVISGTPSYLAPELGLLLATGTNRFFDMASLQKTDLWSLGCTIWEILNLKRLANEWLRSYLASARLTKNQTLVDEVQTEVKGLPVTFWKRFNLSSTSDPLTTLNASTELELESMSLAYFRAYGTNPGLTLKSLLDLAPEKRALPKPIAPTAAQTQQLSSVLALDMKLKPQPSVGDAKDVKQPLVSSRSVSVKSNVGSTPSQTSPRTITPITPISATSSDKNNKQQQDRGLRQITPPPPASPNTNPFQNPRGSLSLQQWMPLNGGYF